MPDRQIIQMEKRIIICDKEQEYAVHLAEQFLKQESFDIQVQTCTSFATLKKLEESYQADILFISEKISYEQRRTSLAHKRFVLTEQEGKERDEEESFVCKYQSADAIFMKMLEVCLDDRQELFLTTAGMPKRLAGVYSPIHRIGKTSFSFALGKRLAKKYSVLLLTLDEYPGMLSQLRAIEKETKRRTLGDLLYYVKQEEENLGIRMRTMVQTMDGMDYILPMDVSLDLKDVQKRDWELLIEQIIKKSMYDWILIEFSESVQGLLSLLASCHDLYVPVIQAEEEMEKLHQFEEMLEKTGWTKILSKVKYVSLDEGVPKAVQCLLEGGEER